MTRVRLSDAVSAMDEAAREGAARAFARGGRPGVRAFLWEPLRAALRRERGERAVFAAFEPVLRAAKLMEADLHWRESTAVACTIGARRCLVRRGWRDAVTSILDGTGTAPAQALAGGRGGVVRHPTAQGNVILRRYRRGGAIRWLGTLYAGVRWRPFREFWLLQTARRCGLPVAEPVAAIVEPIAPGLYRGMLATIEVPGAQPIHLAVAAAGAEGWSESLARGLRRIHDAGLHHEDLNLGNVLVSDGGEITFVDLDRGALGDAPVSTRRRRAAIARLRRSARKLDPGGNVLSEAELDRLEAIYWRDA